MRNQAGVLVVSIVIYLVAAFLLVALWIDPNGFKNPHSLYLQNFRVNLATFVYAMVHLVIGLSGLRHRSTRDPRQWKFAIANIVVALVLGFFFGVGAIGQYSNVLRF